MQRVEALIAAHDLGPVKDALRAAGVPDWIATDVWRIDAGPGEPGKQGPPARNPPRACLQVELVVHDALAPRTIDAIRRAVTRRLDAFCEIGVARIEGAVCLDTGRIDEAALV